MLKRRWNSDKATISKKRSNNHQDKTVSPILNLFFLLPEGCKYAGFLEAGNRLFFEIINEITELLKVENLLIFTGDSPLSPRLQFYVFAVSEPFWHCRKKRRKSTEFWKNSFFVLHSLCLRCIIKLIHLVCRIRVTDPWLRSVRYTMSIKLRGCYV